MDQPIIDPNKVGVLIAGGAGAFLSILFQRSASRLTIFTTIACAEIVDYYFATPTWRVLHQKFNWADSQWQGPVAFSLGLIAIFLVGGITKAFSEFSASPLKTLADLVVSIVKRITPWSREP